MITIEQERKRLDLVERFCAVAAGRLLRVTAEELIALGARPKTSRSHAQKWLQGKTKPYGENLAAIERWLADKP